MTQPTPPTPGVVADVAVRVISIDEVANTASVRVIDNNGGFITAAVSLPIGVVRVTKFPTAVWDVLESADAKATTAVVRWVDATGQQWSESPTGVPAHSTLGWKKIAAVTPPTL